MRRLAPLLALAALTVAPGAEATIVPSCRAYADVPTAQSWYRHAAHGGFTCDTPRAELTVEVCLEVLGENLWERIACATETAANATEVSATAEGCRYGLHVVRSVAIGSASTGAKATAESPPIALFCTPL